MTEDGDILKEIKEIRELLAEERVYLSLFRTILQENNHLLHEINERLTDISFSLKRIK